MNCKRYESWVKDAALGELDPRRHTVLTAHLAGCARCRRAFDAERQLAAAIDEGLAESLNCRPSAEFAAGVRTRLAEDSRTGKFGIYSPRRTWALACGAGLAALAMLVVAIGLLHRARRQPVIAHSSVRSEPAHIVERAGTLRSVSAAGRPSQAARLVAKAAPVRHLRHSNPQRQSPQFQVLVQPGQWAAITAAYRAAQSGRVDASSLTREAAEDLQRVEIKPVDVKLLAFSRIQGTKPPGSAGL
jgi:Putative zinc-finger